MLEKTFALLTASLLFVGSGTVNAQSSGLTRVVVADGDVSVPHHHGIIDRVELAPSGTSGWHTHAGDELTYVTEGTLTLLVANKPPQRIESGEGFIIPAGIVHNIRNETLSTNQLLSIYVVEKGKPLVSPAKAPTSTR